jgi:FKBP-type peptidyl-prolyl cis-trans isomerase
MKKRQSRLAKAHHDYQQLELRQLMAGNVVVSLQANSLVVSGDGAANQIQLSGTPDGRVRVTGLTGTNINSGTAAFVVDVPVRDVTVQMGNGDDSVDIENLVTTGFLNVDLGSGIDSLEVRDINVRVLNVDGRAGNDVMQFHNTFSHGYITMQGGDGNDAIAVTAMATSRGFLVTMENGADLIAIDNLGVRENLNLSTGAGNDQIFMTGEVYAHKTLIELGADNDTLGVLPDTSQAKAVFQKRLNVQAGAGDDTVFFGASTNSRKSTSIDGGSGSDSVGAPGARMRRASYTQFENGSLTNIDQQLDAFYSSLQNLNIDTAPFGRVIIPSVLTVQGSTLVVPANSSAIAVDNQLTLTGGSTTTVSSASVRIQGNISTEDVLGFTNSGNISGTFNASSGVLTLTGTGTLADYQAALRTVTYDNTRAVSLTGSRQIIFDVITSTGTATGTRALSLQGLTPANLSVNNNPLTIPQTSPPVAVDNQLTLTGDSQIVVSGATVAVVNFTAGQDVLAFANANGISGTFDATTGVLTLSGNGTLAAYQTALRTVTYDTSATAFAANTISFAVNTNAGIVTDTRSLVPAAVLSVSATPLKHYGFSPANAVDNQLVLTGQPGTNVTQAQVSITDGYVSGEDLLAFANTSNITGNFNAATGVLTLSGTGTVAEFQSALRSVTYDNTNSETLEETRKIEILVSTNQGDFTAVRDIDLGDQLTIQAYVSDNGLTTQTTASGLHYIIDVVGNGTHPTINDTVRVNYVGTLVDGTQFDANDNITFPLTNVIEGWQEGIPLFSVGGSGRLIIPSSLAYGPTARPGIPANSVLVFDIDLLGIEP